MRRPRLVDVPLARAAAAHPVPPPSPGRDSPGRGAGPAAQPAPSPRSRQRRSPGAALIVPPAPGTMDELDQSPLVSSSSSSGPPRPQQPQFNYQFVLDDEKEEDEDEEEEEEDEDFDEQLEVMERKPVAAPQERPSPPQDRGSPAEPPRPAAPEPEREPPQPAWSPPPAASSSSSAASTPSPGPERPAPPQPEPRRRGSSSGSADETLFALPATSAPLMHSSSDKVVDLQEQPGSTKSLGQEDFTAVPLDTAASLLSFSPLSADPFKEHAAFDTLSDGLPARGIYKESASEVCKETMENVRNPFLAEGSKKDTSEMKYSEMEPSFAKAEAAILFQAEEEVQLEGPKELCDLGKMPAQQLGMSPETPKDLFEKNEEDVFSSKDKGRDADHGDKKALKEDAVRREEYVDFKPYEPIWEVKGASDGLSSLREDTESKIDGKLETSLDEKYGVDKLAALKDYERDSEGSAEDLSFPSTPEAVKEPSQNYITCTKFESSITPDGNEVKSICPVEEDASENRTDDEKKIAEMKAQNTEQGDFSSRAVGKQEGLEADDAKTDSASTPLSDTAASMPEGLTPDLVQEAYESEMHDAASTKLAYETKIDLVQTSESVQETLKPVTQLCPSFEGSEAAPSPILPDIVMEAPLSSGTAGAEASTVQLEASPLGTFVSTASYENVKQEAEKPPSYQEALNAPLALAQEAEEELTLKKPDRESSTSPEDLETSYISIACDLIKETKVSGESASPSLTDYSTTPITEHVSQGVPEHKELGEKLSPQFGKSDLFDSQVIPDFPGKESEDQTLILNSTSVENIENDEEHEQLVDSLAATGKPYLESFQAELDSSKIVTTQPSEPTPAKMAKAEKIPLQMEELNALAYSTDVSIATEPKPGDSKGLSPIESSPVSVEEDFVMLVDPKTGPEFVAEVTDRETMHKNEREEISHEIKDEKRQLPCPELPCDLSVKNVEVKTEEDANALRKSLQAMDREVPEVSMVSLPAADTSPLPTEKEIVSVGKPEAFEKEAEREAASAKEKEKPTAVFSAKLNISSVVDLLYWRDIKKTGVVFGASLFLLLSLTVFSIVSVTAYIALALLSVTISFRIYKGVIQAIQKSDEGHPFRAYLESDVAVSEELIQKYSNVVLGHINGTVKELRRLFLVDDLVDSLKFAVLMWVFTYVGALFNGLTLLILALISLFSVPVIYERHQAQIDHYLGLVNKNVKDAMAKIQAKIPGLKRKTE
ncbi:reticulon-4 isoform X2 [Numida meleagris]|uniref:reticulon-4 isoform X2 n=1 Tax=Numida meleagris TaxID=8996 RepID=UPI000B3E0688|nr:reticulon-4 isoform X2 [Numida meleagris]